MSRKKKVDFVVFCRVPKICAQGPLFDGILKKGHDESKKYDYND